MKKQPVGVDAHIDPLYLKPNIANIGHGATCPNNAGITLIALIVTIIVLLILAGISLNLINGGDGIIIQAQWSEFVAEYTKLDEQKELYVAAKQMDKLSEEFSKVDWRSLFTNVSYALDVPETMYPVDLNQPFSIWDTADTLKATICYVENMQYSDLFNKDKVNLYRVDMSLLLNVEVRRSYIINIVSGMLYYIDGEPHRGLIYHTLKYGVPKNPEFPTPPPDPETDLKIHYLSGFDDQEETQTVPFSQSNSATLDANTFATTGYNFQHWKEIQLDASGNPQLGTYTGIIYPDNASGVFMNGYDMWLEADWTSDPMNEITLDANGGIFDEDDVRDKLFSYQMPDAEHVKFNKKEGDAFGSELLIQPQLDKYEFEGWFTEKSGGTKKSVGNIYHQSELSNDTLYAHWKKVPDTPIPSNKDLTIHYLSRDAELDYSEPSYTQVVPAAQTASATLDRCRFTGPGNGYTFLGWKVVMKNTASSPYQRGGYYDVANLLIKIFDAGWQEEILDIIESYEDWETDAGGEDDGEGVTDDEPEPTMEEERRAEILDYFSGEETAIQNLFTNSTMSLNGLADWFVANQTYLKTLQAYEETLEEDDEESLEVDYYDQQSGINMNGQDLWLEAVWTNAYLITLDANGGKIDGRDRISVTIEAGDDYDTVIFDPVAPDGFTFKGWFTTPTGGAPFDTTTIFDPGSSPRTLYAQYEDDDSDNIVEIIFDGNGGTMLDDDGNSVGIITKNKVIGSLFGTMPTPDRLGYIFEGWFTTPTGGNEVKSSDAVTGTMKLYAHWTEGNFVKLDLQGGEIYTTKAKAWQKKVYNKWNPYKFYMQMNNGFSGIVVKNGEPIGYQARGYMICRKKNKGWQLPTFKNLYAYTATSGKAYRGVRINNNFGVKLNGKPYKKITRLIGWYSKPNGEGNLVEPQDIWDSSKIEDPSDPTLYAYILEDLTITYDANGGFFGKPAKNVTKKQFYNKVEGKKYPRVGRPKRDGYRFLGWYDAPTGGNKIVPNNKNCLMRRDAQTVYAQWEEMKFTVQASAVDEQTWSHSYSINKGDFSTCTIKYKWSTQPRGTKRAKVHTLKESKTTVTNRQPGKTYYVWAVAISKNKEKFYSNVATVALQYAPLAFNVNVPPTSVGNTGWTQSASSTLGNLSGYTVTYQISETQPSSNNATGTWKPSSSSNPFNVSVTGKKEGTTYYVWAIAKKGSGTYQNIVGSSNYVMVKTGHTHTGSSSSGGGCYGKLESSTPCYYKYYCYGFTRRSASGSSYLCLYCGGHHSRGTIPGYSSDSVLSCTAGHFSQTNRWISDRGIGFLYSEISHIATNTWIICDGTNGNPKLQHSTYTSYSINCGKDEKGSATSMNF